MIRRPTVIWRLGKLVPAAALAFACHRESAGASRVDAAASTRDTTLGVAAPDPAAQSAARFVQGFYAWYKQMGEQYATAVHDSPGFFSPALLSAMQLDLAAQRSHPNEVSGLDWDPFLATQDPCDPYQVTGTTRRGDTILVAVNGMCTGREPRPQQDVIAEVRSVGGRWLFADFRHVDDHGSLLQDLKALRDARGPDTVRARP